LENNEEKLYSVGELGQRCGVTVRTLQYYDKEGLLSPSRYSEGGRRLYTREDIFLLQQILFLKSFGFSLADIRDCLMKTESAKEIAFLFSQQREVIQEQIKKLEGIASFLFQVIGEINNCGEIGTEKLVAIMELMQQKNPYAFLLRYFKNDDIKTIISTINIDQPVEAAWAGLFEELFALNRAGVDPESEQGQEFTAKWWAAIQTYAKGDSGMTESMFQMGTDVDNWPESAGELKIVTKEFLAKAFEKYFKDKN
jgi:MerR family transcriptional regulator, thiopeptide resistance regulator